MTSKCNRKKHRPPDGEHRPWWAWLVRSTAEGFFVGVAEVVAVVLLRH
ncbi:hypothetical protein ABIA32_002720 [Streptacidiphilus sp. MAP12-20]